MYRASPLKAWPQLGTRLTEEPPNFEIGERVGGWRSCRLPPSSNENGLQKVLIHLRISLPHVLSRQAEQIDDHHVP